MPDPRKAKGQACPLPDGFGFCRYHIVDHLGVKIGLLGLVEHEWLATMPLLESDDVMYLDFVSEGQRLCQLLRDEYEVDIVVALTHMRAPNDLRLGSQVPGIDLILGGHDHHYNVERCHPSNTLLFKSGTDFRELSLIHMHRAGSSWVVCSCTVCTEASVVHCPKEPYIIICPHCSVGPHVISIVVFEVVAYRLLVVLRVDEKSVRWTSPKGSRKYGLLCSERVCSVTRPL